MRLTKRMSVEEAFRATVLECLAQVGGNAPAIRARDPRGIHQIRVGLRRLQMALKSSANMPIRRRSRRWAGAAALWPIFSVRHEISMFSRAELLPRLDPKFAEHESFAALQLALRHARGEAWDDALAEMLNPEFGAFLNDVAAVAETLPHNDTRIGKIFRPLARRAVQAGEKARSARARGL